MIKDIKENFKNAKKEIIIAFSVIFLLLSCIQIIHVLKNIPYSNLTRDPNAIAEFPKYIGFISQFGILLWAGSTVVCFFGYFLTYKYKAEAIISRFLIFFGFFSLILCLDDTYMLHEEMAHRGFIEQYFYLLYVVMLILFMINFWKLFFSTNYILLLISAAFLACSILQDQFNGENYLLDDSFKLSGIVFWFIYCFKTSLTYCRDMNSK